jgi:hypothetical protein
MTMPSSGPDRGVAASTVGADGNGRAPAGTASLERAPNHLSRRKTRAMSIISLAWPFDDDGTDHLEPPAAASDPVWPRVLHARMQGAGIVQIRRPDEPARDRLARSRARGLIVRRGVAERLDDRQGPTMRTGH